MDNKLSELSKPVGIHPEVREFIETGINDATTHDSVDQCDYLFAANLEKLLQPLYSQEYVSALDEIAQHWIGESAGWKKRAEDAEKRIAELEGQLQSGFTPEALAQEERAENAEQ
jgi:hypothetical protein